MAAGKDGRPLMTLIITAPNRTVRFVGNIWDVLIEESNAYYHGFTTAIKDAPAAPPR